MCNNTDQNHICVSTAKTLINLGIHQVCLYYSLYINILDNHLIILHPESAVSGQSRQLIRLIRVFGGCTGEMFVLSGGGSFIRTCLGVDMCPVISKAQMLGCLSTQKAFNGPRWVNLSLKGFRSIMTHTSIFTRLGDLASWHFVIGNKSNSRQRKTKALVKLCRCAGSSVFIVDRSF